MAQMMRKVLLLAAGWVLVVAGAILMFTPIPVPLAGILPLLLGCAILSGVSKTFRRRLQGLRHRSDMVSRFLERHVHRVPRIVKVMIHRTRPHALRRHARMLSARKVEPPR
jgi:hypothetical protein